MDETRDPNRYKQTIVLFIGIALSALVIGLAAINLALLKLIVLAFGYALLASIGLVIAAGFFLVGKRYAIPCLGGLAEAYEKWIKAHGQRRRNAVLAYNEHIAVVDSERFPLTSVTAIKDYHINQTITAPSTQQLLAGPSPTALLFADVLPTLAEITEKQRRSELDAQQWVLGRSTTDDTLLTVNFVEQLRSSLLGGLSQFGKSSTTAWLACNAVASGFRLVLLDPHAKHQTKGLAPRLAPLHEYFSREPCNARDPDDVVKQFRWLRSEYERRANTEVLQQPLLIVIDEYSDMLALFPQKSVEYALITSVIAQLLMNAAKFGMYLLMASHTWHVERTGKQVRQNVIGRFAHRHSDVSQVAMSLDYHDLDELKRLTTPELGKGEVIARLELDGNVRLRIPYTTLDDVTQFAELLRGVTPNYKSCLPNYKKIARQGYSAHRPPYNTPSPMTTHPLREQIAQHAYQAPAYTATMPLSEHTMPHTDTLIYPPPVHTETTDTHSELSPTEPTQEEKEEICTQEVRAELPNYKKKAFQGELDDHLKARIRQEAESMLQEFKKVPRKLLQKRLGISDWKYGAFSRYCDLMGYPTALPDDIPDAEWEALKASYDYRCASCGKQEPFPEQKPHTGLEKDHVRPREQGGLHHISNIQPLCKACNETKGQRHIDYRRKETTNAV